MPRAKVPRTAIEFVEPNGRSTTCEATPQIGTYQVIHVPGLPAGDRSTPPVYAPVCPDTLALQQFLKLPEVGGHGLPDPWHGDAPKQAARTV